jgi:hypothetical protein
MSERPCAFFGNVGNRNPYHVVHLGPVEADYLVPVPRLPREIGFRASQGLNIEDPEG